ncbi:hypothetical protein HOLleu_09580 [Holothuria leucospilota]|uniref:Uncharacterized protein n=1 Tax=Holothuria leucospilota TaxID=206669 RepID=A0A9Q1CCF9_HOLLE|nr:hypothetical protein HOLleu_09580 [Holothuria leucospilota]
MASRSFVWVAYPSSISRTMFCFEAPDNLMKCTIHLVNMGSCIHPVLWHSNIAQASALSSNSGFIRTCGNMNSGGTKDPVTLMHIPTVTSCPRSTDVSEPT